MLRARLITGALLIAALVALGWADEYLHAAGAPAGAVIGALLALAIVPLLSMELAALLRGAGLVASSLLLMVSGWGGIVATAGIPGLMEPAQDTATVAMAVLAIVAIGAAMSRGRPDGAAGIVGAALLAFVLCGVLPGYWLKVRVDFSMQLFVGAILVVKSSDIGAYFGGRALGRHKLISWLSPGKTWEGAIAGAVVSAAVAAGLAIAWEGGLGVPTPLRAALAGAILAAAGLFGDLSESLLKREAGVKDSGRCLPGMGGLFDVLDSLLIAGPVAWLLLRA